MKWGTWSAAPPPEKDSADFINFNPLGVPHFEPLWHAALSRCLLFEHCGTQMGSHNLCSQHCTQVSHLHVSHRNSTSTCSNTAEGLYAPRKIGSEPHYMKHWNFVYSAYVCVYVCACGWVSVTLWAPQQLRWSSLNLVSRHNSYKVKSNHIGRWICGNFETKIKDQSCIHHMQYISSYEGVLFKMHIWK